VAQPRAEIGGGRGMAGLVAQGGAHGGLGDLDIALAVARNAEIEPGIGPVGGEAEAGDEGLFGVLGVADGKPCLTIGVMRLRQVRRRMTGVAGGKQGALRILGGQAGGVAAEMGEDFAGGGRCVDGCLGSRCALQGTIYGDGFPGRA
jgi:hypothetical protein